LWVWVRLDDVYVIPKATLTDQPYLTLMNVFIVGGP